MGFKGDQVTKPIILVKTCYKTIVFHSSSLKHLAVIGDFLTSADIKAFWSHIGIGLLLVGLALYYTHAGCFCLAFPLQVHTRHETATS